MTKGRRSNNNRRRKRNKYKRSENSSSDSETNGSTAINDGVSTASNIGKGLIQFVFFWVGIAILFISLSKDRRNTHAQLSSISNATDIDIQLKQVTNPPIDRSICNESFTADKESQLSLFGITDNGRDQYHPVVKFPCKWVKQKRKSNTIRTKMCNYTVLDLTTNDNHEVEAEPTSKRVSCNPIQRLFHKCKLNHMFAVGKYDENRIGLYTTPLFQNTSNLVDGYQGLRTIHLGIDLFGPVGHKVFAFADGILHSAGYNAALGDYGHVIVVEHEVGSVNNTKQKLWALYGHLDSKSIQGKTPGRNIRKGQVLGRMGDVHENGGWPNPHVHFQLSIYPPETHDMPGVVSKKDREKALVHYPDPRIVLGQLY